MQKHFKNRKKRKSAKNVKKFQKISRKKNLDFFLKNAKNAKT